VLAPYCWIWRDICFKVGLLTLDGTADRRSFSPTPRLTVKIFATAPIYCCCNWRHERATHLLLLQAPSIIHRNQAPDTQRSLFVSISRWIVAEKVQSRCCLGTTKVGSDVVVSDSYYSTDISDPASQQARFSRCCTLRAR
jgi:hypothetical protein